MKWVNKIHLLILMLVTASTLHAQKTIQLGSLQLKLVSPSVCNYEYKNRLVENYWEIKNDTFYTYDVWYTVLNDGKKEVDQIVWEAGALKDIVESTCEIDSNDAADSTCRFSIFIYDEAEGNGSSFYRRDYRKEGPKDLSWHGILLVFCNDYALFDRIKAKIMEGRKK